MLEKIIFLYFTAVILLTGCALPKKSKNTAENSQYKRAPIVEIPEQRLQNDALAIDAKLQKELGFNDKAILIYHELLKKDSNYTVAWFDLGELYFMEGNFEKAVPFAQKAINLNPKNIWYRLQLAEIYRNTFRMKDAAKEYQHIVKIQPDELTYYYEWANALLLAGEGEGAVKVYDLLEKKIGITETVSMQKQAVWKSMGRTDKVIEEAERLHKQNPNEIKYNAVLAELYMSQKNYPKALKYYEKIKEIDPDNKYINISMAEYYKAVNQQEKAYESLKNAFLNKNLEFDTKLQVLITFYSPEEFHQTFSKYTFDLLQILHSYDPDNIRIQPIYGELMLRRKNYREAADAFQKVLQKDSSKYEIFEAYLVSLSYLNDYQTMITASEKVMRLFPAQPLPYYFNGIAHFDMKEYEKTEQIMQRGLRWVVNNNDLLAGFFSILGECYHQIKNNEKSDLYFDKTLEIEPDNEIVLNNYAYYLSLRKEHLTKAESMSKKTLIKHPESTTYMDTYAWIMFQMGYYKEALILIKQVMTLQEDPDAVILEHYADILYKNNRIEEAKKYWKLAAEKEKGSDTLLKKVEKGIWVE